MRPSTTAAPKPQQSVKLITNHRPVASTSTINQSRSTDSSSPPAASVLTSPPAFCNIGQPDVVVANDPIDSVNDQPPSISSVSPPVLNITDAPDYSATSNGSSIIASQPESIATIAKSRPYLTG